MGISAYLVLDARQTSWQIGESEKIEKGSGDAGVYVESDMFYGVGSENMVEWGGSAGIWLDIIFLSKLLHFFKNPFHILFKGLYNFNQHNPYAFYKF